MLVAHARREPEKRVDQCNAWRFSQAISQVIAEQFLGCVTIKMILRFFSNEKQGTNFVGEENRTEISRRNFRKEI